MLLINSLLMKQNDSFAQNMSVSVFQLSIIFLIMKRNDTYTIDVAIWIQINFDIY